MTLVHYNTYMRLGRKINLNKKYPTNQFLIQCNTLPEYLFRYRTVKIFFVRLKVYLYLSVVLCNVLTECSANDSDCVERRNPPMHKSLWHCRWSNCSCSVSVYMWRRRSWNACRAFKHSLYFLPVLFCQLVECKLSKFRLARNNLFVAIKL